MKPADLTAALCTLTQAGVLTRRGGQDGEFAVTMPAAFAQHLGVSASDSGGQAGVTVSGILGQRIHITGSRHLRHTVRTGSRVEVTFRLDEVARGEASAALLSAGYPEAEVTAVLDEAEKFPGRYAYTEDRHRAACMHMPGGRWEIADTTQAEDRIAALRTRRASMLRAGGR